MTTITTPAGAPAGGSPRTRRRGRRGSAAAARARRRRRDAAALAHRVVAAAYVFDDVVAPPELPDERLFMRRGVLEPAEVRALLEACSASSRSGARDRALIAVGFYACGRATETSRLQRADVDLEHGALTLRGAGGARSIELPPEAQQLVAAWCARRDRLRDPRAHTGLFCTLAPGERPGPITKAGLQDALERAARVAKITKPVSLEALQLARVKQLALAGVDLAELCDLLDHLRLRTTGAAASDRGELVRDLHRTRRLVTELAPQARCLGSYTRATSIICQPGYATGRTPANRGQAYPAEVLTPEELNAMLRQLPGRRPLELRDRALIVAMWRCGLRIAEALALEVRDVDRDLGTLTVRHGKGNKRRIVGIDPQAAKEIARWLQARERIGLGSAGAVFVTLAMPYRGRPMSYTNARRMLQHLARKAGILKRVHPHGLRHTHAFELMQEGVPLPIIQKQLGHNDLVTTARYVDHLAPVHVIKAMQARAWAVPG
jgi:site-specific recombinase XerD